MISALSVSGMKRWNIFNGVYISELERISMAATTKKQHYVWRKYLVPWTNNGSPDTGKVFVYRKKAKGTQQVIEQRELMKIGFENYFYDISGFTKKDISVYKQFLAYIQKDQLIQFGVNMEALELADIQKDFIEKEIMCTAESIDNSYHFLDQLKSKDPSFYRDSTKQVLINTLRDEITNRILFQEQVLSDQELIQKVVECMDDIDTPDLKYEFNLFFCVQYFRSPKIHGNFSKSFEDFRKLSSNLSDLKTNFFVKLITLYYAQKMALNITQNLKSKLIVYENRTEIPFITGDTPIVAYPSSSAQLTRLYYPISPKIAVNMMISNIFPFEENRVILIDDASKVKEFNDMLYKNCVNEVYANDNRLCPA